MKSLFALVAITLCAFTIPGAPPPKGNAGAQGGNAGRRGMPAPTASGGAASAQTYEHLATAIIELRATEDSLVGGLLQGYYEDALDAIQDAGRGTGGRRALERAAAALTNIANEGDKSIQAIRQRLLEAGHHHHTDSETEEDYIFIDSKEKAVFLELAKRVARSDQGSLKGLLARLEATFDKAMASR